LEFTFTSKQEMLRKAAREFAEREVAPRVQEMDETGEVPMDLVKKMFDLGFGGLLIPQEYGGSGMGHVARMIVIEEISRISPPLGFTLQIVHLGQAPVIYFGSEEQKRKWLPELAKGALIASSAVTEPTGGSDVLGIQTTARKEGDEWVISGRKCFITNAHFSNIHGVLAKTGDREFSYFMVEADRPGVKLGRKEDKFGLRGCVTGEIAFDEVRVPEENLVGSPGKGLRVALASISNVGRPGVAAVALGILRRCLEEAAKYAKERKLYGKPISDLQAIQWKLTDIYMDYQTSWLLVYYAAWLRDQNIRVDAENAMCKLWATEAAVRAAKLLTEVFGAYGVLREYVPQRLLRDAQVLIPSAGTSDIMRVVMARKALEFSP